MNVSRQFRRINTSKLTPVGERELESGLQQLPDVRPLDVLLLLNLGNSQDLDAPESGSVSGGHVLVQGLDSGGSAQLSELLVHVVGTGSRVVSEPDTEVLDLQGLLLVDGVDGNDLSRCLLDLFELSQEVPESGLGDDLVGSEDPHSAARIAQRCSVLEVTENSLELGRGVGFGGKLSSQDGVFLESGHFL